MKEFTYTITDPVGIHARPAGMLAKKVNEHRDVIKQKLNEHGAPSVTKLDPTKYEEMFNFLESL